MSAVARNRLAAGPLRPVPPAEKHPTSIADLTRDLDALRDELATLQAHLTVQRVALRALLRSHPDPAAVLDAWQGLRADTVVAAYALRPGAGADAWLTDRMHAVADDWAAELAALAHGDVDAPMTGTTLETPAGG